MAVFDLSKNPFYIIGAPLDASDADIADLSEDAIVDGRADELLASQAQQSLIPPRLRLEAELGWFADVSSEAARILSELVISAELDTSIAEAKRAAPLSRANAAAHLCGRFNHSQLPLSLLVDAWNEMQQDKVFAAITAARQSAGFPLPDRDHFNEAIRKLEVTHARQAVAFLHSLGKPGSTLTKMVEAAIKQNSFGLMLRRIVREYDKASEARLEAVREDMMAELSRFKTDSESAPRVVERLRNLLSSWDEINQPVQLLEQADGHEEERSRRLCRELRALGLALANEHGRHREALVLTKALLSTFPELESTAAQLRQDIRILEDIVGRLPPPPTPRTSPAPLRRQDPPSPYKMGSLTDEASASKVEKLPGFGGVSVMVGILGIFFFLIAWYDTPPPRQPSTPHITARPTTSTSPTNTLTLDARAGVGAVAPTRVPTPVRAAPPAETEPPVNAGRPLFTSELRYCVFQGARLDYLRHMLSRNNQSETDRFNVLIERFNSRCGRYSYLPENLVQIEAEARRRSSELASEAAAIITDWRIVSVPQALPQQPQTPSAPTQFAPARLPPPATGASTSDTIAGNRSLSPTETEPERLRLLNLRNPDDARLAQKRLQELGYYQARIDGGFGPVSFTALRAFKRDHPRLPADGEWDLETQRALLKQ